MYRCEPANDGAKLSSNMSPLGKFINIQDTAYIVWAGYTGLHIGGQVGETWERSYFLKPVQYAVAAINLNWE